MADNSSTKKPRFLPDPSKWIQTAPSTSSARKPQRPLTSFRNTFATPPTTVKRLNEKTTAGPSKPKSNRPEDGTDSQRISISGFFTPPTTSQRPLGVKKDGSGTPSKSANERKDAVMGKAAMIRKSRLNVRADEDDSSPDSGDEVIDRRDVLLRNQKGDHRPITTQQHTAKPRAKVVPLQIHRSAPVTSSSSGMSDALDQAMDMKTPLNRRRRKYRTLTSSPSPSPAPSPVFPAGSPDDAQASHVSSDRPITPVPDYVLEIHRRLCGRDERLRRVESPLKTRGDAGAIKRSRKEIKRERGKHAIDERAHDQALVRRRRNDKENENEGKRLVVGSSQLERDTNDSPKHNSKRKRGHSPMVIPPLIPMVVNTIRHGPPIKRETTHTDIQSSHRTRLHSNAFSPSAVYEELCGRRDPSPPPARKLVQTPPKSRSLRRIPTGMSPGSAIPLNSPSPIKAHTPPTSSRSGEPMMPPPDPVSEPRISSRDFKPVPMQAETLLSWSGGMGADAGIENTKASGAPVRPDPRPNQHHQEHDQASLQRGEDGSAETQSLPPSLASQSFPSILPSPTRPVPSVFNYLGKPDDKPPVAPVTEQLSPTRTKTMVQGIMPESSLRTPIVGNKRDAGGSRSIVRFPTKPGVAETVYPAHQTTITRPEQTKGSSKSPTPTPKLKSRMSTGWPAFGFADTTPTNPAYKRSLDQEVRSPSTSSTKRRRTTSPTAKSTPVGTQSKLAAFGFFGEKPKKQVRGFEEDWEMEDDLQFAADMEDRPEVDGNKGKSKIDGLKAVPPPPPHPALRPAGLRELKKREQILEASRPRIERYNDTDNVDDNDNDIEQLFPDIQASSSQNPGPVGSSTSASASASSSFTTDDELGMGMGSSAAAWWDGLEDRRSSEFGSFT